MYITIWDSIKDENYWLRTIKKTLWITGVYKSRIQAIWEYGPKTLIDSNLEEDWKLSRESGRVHHPNKGRVLLYTRVQVYPDNSLTHTPIGDPNWHRQSSARRPWVQNFPEMAQQTPGNQEMCSLVFSLYCLQLLHSSIIEHPLFFLVSDSSKHVTQPHRTWIWWTGLS